MKQILHIKLTKVIESLIIDRIIPFQEPYRYQIKGKSGGGCDSSYSAHATWKKIKEWAEKNGAEAILIRDRYQEIGKQAYHEYMALKDRRGYYPNGMDKYLKKGQSKGYLIVEITDPVAYVIDKVLTESTTQKVI